MPRRLRLALIPLLLLAAVSLARASGPALIQYGTIDALLAGGYDGDLTVSRLLDLGGPQALGLGTYDGLDGEMVVLDGTAWKVGMDGRPARMPGSALTPFACVARFAPTLRLTASGVPTLAEMEALLDRALPTDNVFWAVRISGDFTSARTRSVPRQSRPYPPLAEVVKHQGVFDIPAGRATVLGFRGPAWSKGFGVPGWHLHLITDDRERGGHLLDCAASRVVVELMPARDLRLLLPQNDDFARADLARDRSGELHGVERDPGKATQ